MYSLLSSFGGYTLSASVPSLASATNAQLTVQSGAMTRVAFITPPANGTTMRTVFGSVPAVFDDIVIDRAGTEYTIVASSGGMTVTSATFSIQ